MLFLWKTRGIGRHDSAAHYQVCRFQGRAYALPGSATAGVPAAAVLLADAHCGKMPQLYQRLLFEEDDEAVAVTCSNEAVRDLLIEHRSRKRKEEALASAKAAGDGPEDDVAAAGGGGDSGDDEATVRSNAHDDLLGTRLLRAGRAPSATATLENRGEAAALALQHLLDDDW